MDKYTDLWSLFMDKMVFLEKAALSSGVSEQSNVELIRRP